MQIYVLPFFGVGHGTTAAEEAKNTEMFGRGIYGALGDRLQISERLLLASSLHRSCNDDEWADFPMGSFGSLLMQRFILLSFFLLRRRRRRRPLAAGFLHIYSGQGPGNLLAEEEAAPAMALT